MQNPVSLAQFQRALGSYIMGQMSLDESDTIAQVGVMLGKIENSHFSGM